MAVPARKRAFRVTRKMRMDEKKFEKELKRRAHRHKLRMRRLFLKARATG